MQETVLRDQKANGAGRMSGPHLCAQLVCGAVEADQGGEEGAQRSNEAQGGEPHAPHGLAHEDQLPGVLKDPTQLPEVPCKGSGMGKRRSGSA